MENESVTARTPEITKTFFPSLNVTVDNLVKPSEVHEPYVDTNETIPYEMQDIRKNELDLHKPSVKHVSNDKLQFKSPKTPGKSLLASNSISKNLDDRT